MSGTGRLAGRKTLLTGAAGGIGRAIMTAFVAEGATVLATDRAAVLAETDGPAENRTFYRSADLRDPTAAAMLIDTCIEHMGGLDILVNNAAARSPRADVTALADEDWAEAMDVNLAAPMRLCRAAIPVMARGKGGVIINIASQLGQVESEARIAYGTSKAGLIFMTRLMARDHAAQNIRINSISPGPVLTGRLIDRAGSANEAIERFAPLTALGKVGTPMEIAAAAVFLASNESAFTTGADFLIDGGYSLAEKS